MKKYKLTGIRHPDNPRLRRIRALRGFEGVRTGDLGGWIEGEQNLPQDDESWIYGESIVCDGATVAGKTTICDGSVVRDNSKVIDSIVGGGAIVTCGSIVIKSDVHHSIIIESTVQDEIVIGRTIMPI